VPSATFPRQVRLTAAADFTQVFKQGVRASDNLLVILAKPNQLSIARLGMAISVKQAGNGVERNRIKRVVREAFRQRQTELAGLDLVVMGRNGLGLRSNAEIRSSVERNWNKLIGRCKGSSSVSSTSISD